MKDELQSIHDSINTIFDYNVDSYKIYKSYIKNALILIRSIPDSKNVMLQNWKAMAIDELQKELNNRLSDKFILLSAEGQKNELKFSKMAASMMIMNVIMHL